MLVRKIDFHVTACLMVHFNPKVLPTKEAALKCLDSLARSVLSYKRGTVSSACGAVSYSEMEDGTPMLTAHLATDLIAMTQGINREEYEGQDNPESHNDLVGYLCKMEPRD